MCEEAQGRGRRSGVVDSRVDPNITRRLQAQTSAARKDGIPGAVRRRAKGIKLLLLDVDGIMTDGRLIFDATGEAQMVFHVRDGHGMKLAQRCGLSLAIITGRDSPMVAQRARELGIQEVHQKAVDKLPVFQALLERQDLAPAEIACMGDDLLDLPLMLRAGLAITVPEAVEEVRRAAHYITRSAGGHGAVREAIELLLKVQGHWPKVLERDRR